MKKGHRAGLLPFSWALNEAILTPQRNEIANRNWNKEGNFTRSSSFDVSATECTPTPGLILSSNPSHWVLAGGASPSEPPSRHRQHILSGASHPPARSHCMVSIHLARPRARASKAALITCVPTSRACRAPSHGTIDLQMTRKCQGVQGPVSRHNRHVSVAQVSAAP